MGLSKGDIAGILEEIGTLLELKGENPFKTRAYHNGARVIGSHPGPLERLLKDKGLESLPGIGAALAAKIRELAATGKLKYHEELRASLPAGLLDMLGVQGLGPRKARILYDKLKINSLASLETACRKGRLAGLAGFGEKSQANILAGLAHLKKSAGSFLVSEALSEAAALSEYLRKTPGLLRLEVAGSLRRRKELVKDIDILVAAKDPERVHSALANYSRAGRVLAQGDTKSSLTLKCGINVDLRTVSKTQYPFALNYFTGSKAHNIEVRRLAQKKGYKINEYGLFKGSRPVSCKDEAAIYKKLGLSFIPPELREGMGELEAAGCGRIPKLVEEGDIRGVFHVHSDYSDGRASLSEMVAEAGRLGMRYVGISEHSRTAAYAHGLDIERLRVQRAEIEKLRRRHPKLRIFWGIESDILADGSLDYPDKILKEFDFVVGSIHSRFKLPESEQTQRILRAMASKYMTFLGHPTGRLLLGREGYAVDMERVLQGAARYGVCVEINAHPERLDLDWRLGPRAKELGVKISINPDAHSLKGYGDISHGVGVARKGWLEASDVVNTFGVKEVERFLSARR